MNSIFLITVTGQQRVKENTRNFLFEAEKLMNIRQIGVDLRHLQGTSLETFYNLSVAIFVAGGNLSAGEVGCLLSHQEIYETIVRENIEWALVIEDDADLLIDSDLLMRLSKEWFHRGYEFVHLGPNLGGVLVGERQDKTGRALVPPLGAYAYWISLKGAFKLRTRRGAIGGLADWPIQMSKVKTRAVFNPLFYSGLENSVIENFQSEGAASRVSLAYRPIRVIFSVSNKQVLAEAISIYGFTTLLKFIFANRIYKRIARILSGTKKGRNNTYFLFHASKHFKFWRSSSTS